MYQHHGTPRWTYVACSLREHQFSLQIINAYQSPPAKVLETPETAAEEEMVIDVVNFQLPGQKSQMEGEWHSSATL